MASQIIVGSTPETKDKGSGTQNSGNMQFSISSLCVLMREMLPFFFSLHMTPNTNSPKYKTRTATYDRKYLTPVSGRNRIKTEKWKVSLKQLFHKSSNIPSGPYFDYISHLLFQKSNLSTPSFSTKVNTKELICIPHAHIPRHLKHSLSRPLCIAKGLLHFANSIRKR